MKQSKKHSLIETTISTAVGFIVSLIITHIVLPIFGFAVTHTQALWIVAIYTVASIARGYIIRRAFNAWHTIEQ